MVETGAPTQIRVLRPTAQSSTSGISYIRSADVSKRAGMDAAVFGRGGVGKTTLVAQAVYSPFGAPMEYVDVEGGSSAISDIDENLLAIIQPGAGTQPDGSGSRAPRWEDILALERRYVDTPAQNIKHPWTDEQIKSVVWDNMSEMTALAMKWVLRQDIKHTGHLSSDLLKEQAPQEIQHWGRLTAEVLRFTRSMRDVARMKGINMFFIAWESTIDNPSQGRHLVSPNFNQKLAEGFCGIVGLVMHLTVNDRGQRVLQLDATDKSMAKFRRNNSEEAAAIPRSFSYAMTDHPMVDLLATLRGGEAWNKKYKSGGIVRVATATTDTATSGSGGPSNLSEANQTNNNDGETT